MKKIKKNYKEHFYNQESFPQSKNFSTVKEKFHKQENFPQKYLLDQRSFPQTRKFTTNKKFFLIKEIFHSQENFAQTKIFPELTKMSANKDQKGPLEAKIIDPFNTDSYAKIFLTF